MDAKRKESITTLVGFCGGGVFSILNILTNGTVPGGFVGGVLGFFVFGGLTALVLHFQGGK